MWTSSLAIALGAALGALWRWQLGLWCNQLYPAIPPGTWLANLIGGYLVGLALAGFAQAPGLDPAWRLFVVTGLCGGLTTFSTFSAEVVALLQGGRWALASGAIALHLGASLLATFAGLASWAWLQGR